MGTIQLFRSAIINSPFTKTAINDLTIGLTVISSSYSFHSSSIGKIITAQFLKPSLITVRLRLHGLLRCLIRTLRPIKPHLNPAGLHDQALHLRRPHDLCRLGLLSGSCLSLGPNLRRPPVATGLLPAARRSHRCRYTGPMHTLDTKSLISWWTYISFYTANFTAIKVHCLSFQRTGRRFKWS